MASPTDFPDTYKIGALTISYDNLMEISQGGPVVGRLLIDGEVFGNNLLFGGPFVIEKKRVYIPLFIRKFCVTGFKVCAINLESLSYELISPMEDVIFLDYSDNGFLYYYNTLGGASGKLKSIPLKA